jgi:hypothetical protein
MQDDGYTLKEVFESNFREMGTHLQEIKKTTQETSEKVGIQNGRVTKLELWSNEVRNIVESNVLAIQQFNTDKASIKGAYKVIITIAIVVPMICTFIFGLYIKNKDYEIDQKIKNAVSAAIENKVDHAIYEK